MFDGDYEGLASTLLLLLLLLLPLLPASALYSSSWSYFEQEAPPPLPGTAMLRDPEQDLFDNEFIVLIYISGEV